jgi:uncharacterized damage-inducible protein DinB
MSEVFRESLLRQFRATHDGEPWYGTSRSTLLRGVSAVRALEHPVNGGHSIWELVLHMTAWTEEVHRRLDGAPPQAPARGDWPAVSVTTERAWRSAREALALAHHALAESIEALPVRRFSLRIATSDGEGVTVAEMLIGLAQHDAYHTGQIVILRQAGKVSRAPR